MNRSGLRMGICGASVLLLCAACAGDSSPLPLVGTLEFDRIELAAEFSESIVEFLVEDGEAVKAGQVLLRQDSARMAQDLKCENANAGIWSS